MISQAVPITSEKPVVAVRTLRTSDLDAVLREGYQDFLDKRGDLIIAGALYPLIGLVASAFFLGASALPMLFPIAAGLTIMGPLVSAGFYELAHRREEGLDSGWVHFFDFWRGESGSNLMFVGAILIGMFGAWSIAAFLIYGLFFGAMVPQSVVEFLTQLFTTAPGWGLIIVGNIVGFAFAVLVLALAWVSLPMIVDGRADAGRAIRVSVRAFNQNRAVALGWGARVAALLALGSIPAFLGLAVVLPVLGYATWHLYTRAVDRETAPKLG